MEDMVDINTICQSTGFTKKQIVSWAKAGIIPGKIKEENRGGREGKVSYYPEETLIRLMSVRNFPVSSLTKQKEAGIPALGFLLFIFGFDDEGIRRNVRAFIKKAARNLLRHFKLHERRLERAGKNLEVENWETPILFRIFKGYPSNEIKARWLKEDTTDETYDEAFEEGKRVINSLAKEAKLKISNDDLQEMSDAFLDAFQDKVPHMLPLSKVGSEIAALPEKDFKTLQASYMFLIGAMKIILEKPPETIVNWFTKSLHLSTFAVLGFYAFKLWSKPLKQNISLGKEFLTIPEKVRRLSEEGEKQVKKEGQKARSKAK